MQKREVKKYLSEMPLSTFQLLLDAGRKHDINDGGLWDARSGVVNFWCSPEDKPEFWREPTQGTLNHPRDYVGGVYYDHDEGQIFISVTPYTMLDAQNGLTDEQWEQCIDWCQEQVEILIREAIRSRQ